VPLVFSVCVPLHSKSQWFPPFSSSGTPLHDRKGWAVTTAYLLTIVVEERSRWCREIPRWRQPPRTSKPIAHNRQRLNRRNQRYFSLEPRALRQHESILEEDP
jgi:hypothetical protein